MVLGTESHSNQIVIQLLDLNSAMDYHIAGQVSKGTANIEILPLATSTLKLKRVWKQSIALT